MLIIAFTMYIVYADIAPKCHTLFSFHHEMVLTAVGGTGSVETVFVCGRGAAELNGQRPAAVPPLCGRVVRVWASLMKKVMRGRDIQPTEIGMRIAAVLQPYSSAK